MMDTVQEVALSFNYSAKRVLRFQETLNNDAICRKEKDRWKKIQSLCKTRWAARSEAFYTFKSAFHVVVAALSDLNRNYSDSKAGLCKTAISLFEFIITLVAVEQIISTLVPLSLLLQSKTCDLIAAFDESLVVKAQLSGERDDLEVWNRIVQTATRLAESIEELPTMPRQRVHQQNRPNAPARWLRQTSGEKLCNCIYHLYITYW